jgi:hypothetical protein
MKSFPGTLRLQRPWGQIPLITLAILFVSTTLLESAARLPSVSSSMHNPVISGDAQLGVKIGLLNDFQQEHGRVDCVFIGSSMVQHGIDPAAIGGAYRQKTGRDLNCFNLGVRGLSDTGAAALAEILIRHYHPRLIVYGTNFRDYQEGLPYDFDIPWAHYMRGQFSVQGWLESESMAYRAFQTYSDPIWTGIDWPFVRNFERDISPLGYVSLTGISRVDIPPDPVIERNAYEAFRQFDPRAALGRPELQRLLALGSDQVTLVVLEMPVPPSAIALLPRKDQDYAEFSTLLEQDVRSTGTQYWPTRDLNWMPLDVWQSTFHLNNTGAQIFSTWVGERLAGAVAGGEIPDPTQ